MGHGSRPPSGRGLVIDRDNSCIAPDALTALAVLYVALPSLIFFGGWLKLPYAVIAVALIGLSLVQWIGRSVPVWTQPYSRGAVAAVLVTGFAWASLGGAGHFVFANSDWFVRDTVLADLTLTPWPPSYGDPGGAPHILRTAFGYFFPPALAAKWLGLSTLDMAAYLWTAAGSTLFLLLLPLPKKPGIALFGALLIAVFFSGMDYLGIVLLTGTTPIFPLRLEWWVPFSYPSLTGQLYWGPNHALPLWIATALFYRHWGTRHLWTLFFTLLPMLFLWTPFAVPALAPFLMLAAWRCWRSGESASIVFPTAIQIVTATASTYLLVRLFSIGASHIGGAPTMEVTPIKESLYDFTVKYLLFILMEFVILALLIGRRVRHSRSLLLLSVALLCLLPLYQYGPSNDSMLRLSTPCLVILMILTLDVVVLAPLRPGNRGVLPRIPWYIVAVLAIGACTPFNEMWRGATFHRRPPNYGQDLVEQQQGFEPPHYIGRLDRPDLRLLLKTPQPVPDARTRRAQGLPPPFSRPR